MTALRLKIARHAAVWLAETSVYLPERRVTTAELALELGVPADELVRLTGVEARYVAAPEEATSDLLIAALRPLVASDEAKAGVDRLLVATVTPDHPSPATAPLVQHALGLPQVPAMDLAAACSGFVYAMDVAARYLGTGDDAVLVAAGECRTRTLGAARPGVRVLFGDGAVAARLVRERPAAGGLAALRLVATGLAADGSGHAAVRVPAGGSRRPASAETVADGLHALQMEDGPMVFLRATEALVEVAEAMLEGLGMGWAEIDLVVPHQPNVRILERMMRLLRLPRDKVVVVADAVGNLGGASVGVALDRARRAGRVPGDGERPFRVLLVTAGAGYTAGAALLEREARP